MPFLDGPCGTSIGPTSGTAAGSWVEMDGHDGDVVGVDGATGEEKEKEKHHTFHLALNHSSTSSPPNPINILKL